MFTIREYQIADYGACLRAFASNVPLFFAAEEQEDYAGFLAQWSCPYLVAELDGVAVGGGGFYLIPDTDLAGLVWGVVARSAQRRGIGTALLRARLEQLSSEPSIRAVRVNTSQHTAGFFERFGFHTERIVEDHFAVGLHQYQMFLRLDSRGDDQSPNHAMERTAGRSEERMKDEF
jgi:ribosomal protein S18 acetylase RimI-like enzyme